jgi:outer membrane receptor protein involved in Fe transport
MQRSRKRKLRRLDGTSALRKGVPVASGLLAALTGAATQAQEAGIGEIIVTATKREERLQDVPLAIQAFGTQQLEELRISDFDDYVRFLPNVSYQQLGPGFSRVFMRGVSSGDNGNHSGPLPSVGMYLDEQPITTIQGPLDIHIYDIERVESLAGPQGTLYGASSQAGTIRIITRKPVIGESSSSYEIEGNYVTEGDAGYQFQGYTNIPVADNVALRLVGWYRHDAGYIDNVFGTRTYPTYDAATGGNGTVNNAAFVEEDYNDVDTIGARAALRIDLNENWTATPSLIAQSQDANGNFAYDPAVGDLELFHFYPEKSDDDWYQAALTVEGRLSDWTLTYAGSYLHRDDWVQSDYTDYSIGYDTLYFGSPSFPWGEYFFNDDGDIINPAQYVQGQDKYTKVSQELRVASPADRRMRFVAGVFYQKQKHDIEQRYLVDDLAASAEVTGWPDTLWLTAQEREDEDRAIFGEATFDVTEQLSVTAGLRYFDFDNSLKGFYGFGLTNDITGSTGEKSCFDTPSPGAGVNGGPCTNLDKSVDDSDETHKLNVTYRIDEDKLVYATYSTGYRPGGVNRRGTFPPYEADFLDNYEIGWKTTWAGGNVQWNGAAFWQQWDDFQFSFLGENGLTNVTNAPGGADIPGVEMDLRWAATDDLTLSAAAMWLQPELDGDFCEDITTTPQTCDAAEFAPDGTTLPVTPEFKGNIVARYAYTLGGLDGNLQGALVYQGSSRPALLPEDERLLGGEQDAYTIVDLSASVEKGDWTLELFVDNVFDERADLYRYAQCDEGICAAGAGLGGSTYIVPNQPRTIGLRFGQKFGGD